MHAFKMVVSVYHDLLVLSKVKSESTLEQSYNILFEVFEDQFQVVQVKFAISLNILKHLLEDRE